MAYSILSVTKMTSAQLATYTGVEGMIVINTDTDSISVLDGTKAGGYSLPNEDTVQNYVNTQVTSIMASGGQILPSAATTSGNVVTWDGGAWQEDPSFAQTSYVDAQINALKPVNPSTATQALQWDGSNFVNVTMTGGSGGGVVPSTATPTGSVLTWDGSAYQNTTGFALSTDLTAAVTALKGTASLSYDDLGKIETMVATNIASINTINTNLANYATQAYVANELTNLLGGASAAYDTLKEIEDFVVTNSSNIGTALTTMATKAPKPATPSGTGSVLTWDGTNFMHNTGFSLKPSSASGADEVLAWDSTLNSGVGGFVQKDLSSLAEVGTAATYTDLGLMETELLTKAPKPPTGIQAGEFLRWDETNEVFTFATPAGGGGGSSIPTPTATTDYSTAGSMEMLIWDNTSGDLKNVASPFAEKGAVTSLTDLASAETAIALKADAPPTQSTANTYLYHDGSSWQYGTPVSSGGSTIGTPAAPTSTNDVVKWNGSAFENASISTIGFTTTGFITPSTTSGTTDVLQWDGSNFVNQPGFATTAYADAVLGNAKPAAATGTNEVVKWNGTAFENSALSTVGFTTSGFITPATTSGSTDVLQWDGSNFVNQSGFAQIGSASTLTNLGLVETAVNAKADAPPTQTASGTYLYHDGTSWQYGTPSGGGGGSSFGTPTANTTTGEMLVWSGGNLINQTATTLGLATEVYVDTAVNNLLGGASSAYDTLLEIENYITNNSDSNMTQLLSDLALKAPTPTATEVTGDGEVLGWDGTNFIKKNITVNGSAFTITETANDIILDPNYSAIDGATGVFEITSVNGEYLIKPKASLVV